MRFIVTPGVEDSFKLQQRMERCGRLEERDKLNSHTGEKVTMVWMEKFPRLAKNGARELRPNWLIGWMIENWLTPQREKRWLGSLASKTTGAS